MNEKEIGARIKHRREALGLSAIDLAEKIGVNKSTVHHYEAGDFKSLKLSTAEAIASALDVSSAWLLGKTDDMTPEKDAFLLKPSDRTDISHIIEAAKQLLQQDGLTFDGIPADPQSVQLITDSLTISLETAKRQNLSRIPENWIIKMNEVHHG